MTASRDEHEKVKPFLCKKIGICDARFDTEEERDEHMRVAHPEPKRERVQRNLGKFHYSRIPNNAEDTETKEDRNKEGPYPLPLDMIAMRCDNKGKSLRPKIRDVVWEFWPEPHWKRVTEYYLEFNRLNEKRGIRKRYRVTKIAIKMAKKIHKELGIKLFPITERTYAGYWQKSLGAWLWCFYDAGLQDYGSSWPMGFLVQKRVKLWIVNDCIGTEAKVPKRYGGW